MAQFIQQNDGADTETLARHFGISLMTARRDLKILEEQNFLRTTWGGAVPLQFQPEDVPYANKETAMCDAKTAIAAKAAEMVQDNTCILLDAGTTTLELAKLLRDRKLTVITTDLQIALYLVASPTVTVHVAGGYIDPVSRACNDEQTREYLRNINVMQAFIGTNVWDGARGVTTSTTPKMRIKRQMMACAEQSVLLADSSKYGHFSTWAVAKLADFSCVITDSGLPGDALGGMIQAGVPLEAVHVV
jgi:Transcriptional regulators of sugar metabolism